MFRRRSSLLAFAVAVGFALQLSSANPVSLEEAKAQLARVEAGDSPDQAMIRALWQETIDAIKRAEESKRKAEDSRATLQSAPAELAKINNQLAEPPTAAPTPNVGTDRDSLQNDLTEIEAKTAKLRVTIADLTDQESRQVSSQGEIPALIVDLESSLSSLGASNPPRPLVTASDVDKANFERNAARRVALATRIAELQAEQNSFSVNRDLLTAKKQLATRDLKALTKSREILARTLDNAQRSETAADQAATISLTSRFNNIPALKETAQRTTELAEFRTGLVKKTADLRTFESRIQNQLEELGVQRAYAQNRINTLEAAHLRIDPETGRLLRLQRAKLPTIRSLSSSLEQNIRNSTNIQFERFKLQDELATIPSDLRSYASKIAKKIAENDVTTADALTEKNITAEDIVNLLTQYRENLTSAIRDSGSYIDEIIKSNTATRQAIAQVRSYSLFIDERLLWISSAPVVAASDFQVEADSIKSFFSRDHFQKWFDATAASIRKQYLYWILIVFVIGVLLIRRKRHGIALAAFGDDASRRTCVSIKPTFKALLITLLLALPLPLAASFLAFCASSPLEFGIAFRDCAFFFATIGFVLALCRPKGIFESHFRVATNRINHLRKYLRAAFFTVPPLIFVTTAIQANPLHPQSGRLLFFLLMALTGTYLHLLLRPSSGLIVQKSGRTWLAKVLHLLGVVIPLSFATGSALGYISSVRTLRIQTVTTIWVILAGLFIATVLTRWILVSRRRLARNQAVKIFKAANAAKKKKDKAEDGSTVISQKEIEANAVDVVVVEEQTTRLLRVGTLVALTIVVAEIWSGSLPALSFLDSFTIWPLHQTAIAESAAPILDITSTLTGGGASSASSTDTAAASSTGTPHRISLQDLLASGLALILTVIAARNIPGLLELTVLRRLTLSPGGNYAVTTVLRYLIVAFGTLTTFGLIGITWGSVQWLAAAVTLGIGFGLQEIFANFVAGIILLFERPMRLGDVVTVGDISGVVRKIQIRATTIQQFNNRELIVPNKEFITGQLVNWTLTDNRQRFDFTVGVAYGSDTVLADKILKKILADHPKVLNEPAPEVFFTSFGDSTLDFQIRAFVLEYAHFLIVQSELHFEIDKRFREADIEIAFPQRDIHIRSIPEGWNAKSEPLPESEPDHLRPDKHDKKP